MRTKARAAHREMKIVKAVANEGGAGNPVARKNSASHLELLEPLNGFTLVGNDLCLPNESNRHEAHGDHAKDKHQTDVGLLSGKPKPTPKPGHGKGSPSTQPNEFPRIFPGLRPNELADNTTRLVRHLAIERPLRIRTRSSYQAQKCKGF